MVLVGMLNLRHDPEKISKAYGYAAVAMAEGIDFFYFSPGCVDFNTNTINGKFLEKGIWINKTVRFPDVIFNSKSQAKTDHSQQIIEQLRRTIPFTSYPVGNKIKVYETLKENRTFSDYLLPTIELFSYENLLPFINEHTNVIVKPINGRKGQDIIKVTELNSDLFLINQDFTQKHVNGEQLKLMIIKLMEQKNYIAQPFNECRTKANEVYDFRLHVQKDVQGKWTLTCIYPRIGSIGSIKSNISSGGKTCNLDPFLYEEFGNNYFNKRQELKQFGLSLAKHMDDIYQVSFDELGIDVAYDSNGKLIIYEINWHPGVPPTFYLEMDVARNTINYAKYLAEKVERLKTGSDIEIVAITGSYGKSTVKSMITSILRKRWNVFESKDNHNTSTNTKYHSWQINGYHDIAVLEYGMGHKDVITKHCDIIKPKKGIITNIGTAHISNFDDGINGIAKAKSELIHGLDNDGILCINADDENSKLLETDDYKGKIITIGIDQPADFRASNVTFNDNGMCFNMFLDNREVNISIPILGKHNVYNALFAIAVCSEYGFTVKEIKEGLKNCRIPDKRLTLHERNGIKIIDDTVHSTIGATKAAIEVLSSIEAKTKIAVLGRIPQLGDYLFEGLREIGEYAASKKIDYLYTIGNDAKRIINGAKELGFPEECVQHFYNKDKLINRLFEQAVNDTAILIKGARWQKLSDVTDSLLNHLNNQ